MCPKTKLARSRMLLQCARMDFHSVSASKQEDNNLKKKTWQISILSPLYLDRTGLVNNSMGLLLVSGKASDCYAASLGFDFRSEKKTGNYLCNNFELFSLSRFLERHIEKAKLTDYLFC